jgi:hypothetical protein
VLLRTAQTSAVCTKFTIHKTLIHPVLLYGSEWWVLTKKEENQLFVFKRKVLRTICRPKFENGVYRRKYNHELNNIKKTSRFRYAGYMIKRPEDLPQRAKPNGRINQGRSKSRWADSLALGVREIGRTVLKTGRHGEIFFNRP